jgi:hypothetical protein
MMMTTNLPSGYHRDLQLLKEQLFPAFETLQSCLEMAGFMLDKIEVKKNILGDEKYKYLFTVEAVNKLVMQEFHLEMRIKLLESRLTEELLFLHLWRRLGGGRMRAA